MIFVDGSYINENKLYAQMLVICYIYRVFTQKLKIKSKDKLYINIIVIMKYRVTSLKSNFSKSF